MDEKIIPVPEPDEVENLLELVFRLHGYDLRQYSRASLLRRIQHILVKRRINIAELSYLLLNEPGFFKEFLKEVTVNVTEFFRDPQVYQALRKEVIPYLASYANLRVWSAGCSRGHEAYSLAILLKEEALLSRTVIYGTDISEPVLKQAETGIYPLKELDQFTESYTKAGGKRHWTDYFTVAYQAGIMSTELREKMVFSGHNLVTDWAFNDFQLIMCRNVLIYFDVALQEKVLKLFHSSLTPHGFLCIGNKETIRFENWQQYFKPVNLLHRIYQKVEYHEQS